MISPSELLDYSINEYERVSNKSYTSNFLEIEIRNCARSSYYSLFNYLKTIADSLPGDYEEGIGSHERVIRKLMSFGDEDQKVLGERLKNSRIIRIRADYKLTSSFDKQHAYKALRYAENAIYNR